MRGKNRVDMIGQRFGRLLAISPAKSKHNSAYWNCLCDCGNVCTAMGKWIRQGKKRSCGCLKKESAQINAKAMTESNNLPFGVAAFNLLYASYRCSSKSRSIEFNIVKNDFESLTKSSCFYCGVAPKVVYASHLPNGGYLYNGVDRKNSSLGYDLENCVPCCKMCNWMKNVYNADEFISQCSAISEHQRIKTQKEGN